LVADLASGKLRGAELDARIERAAVAQQVAEYRRHLVQRLEPAIMRGFERTLESGGAEEIIAALRPKFDASAQILRAIAEVIDPNTDAEQFLAEADDAGRQAWRDIQPHVDMVTRIAAVVCQFGAKSTTFPQIVLAVQAGGDTGPLDDRALLCVDSARLAFGQASAVFARPDGPHRRSAWFLLAGALKLNSIDECRETMRAWAEQAWEAVDFNQGRGYMDGDKFVPTPIANPYARKELAKG
jgi:hypothetical protein